MSRRPPWSETPPEPDWTAVAADEQRRKAEARSCVVCGAGYYNTPSDFPLVLGDFPTDSDIVMEVQHALDVRFDTDEVTLCDGCHVQFEEALRD
jgi:hypothetical protein